MILKSRTLKAAIGLTISLANGFVGWLLDLGGWQMDLVVGKWIWWLAIGFGWLANDLAIGFRWFVSFGGFRKSIFGPGVLRIPCIPIITILTNTVNKY